MPIEKFTSFNKAEKALWALKPDNDYYRTVKNNFDFWSKLADKKFDNGIRKFKNYFELLEYEKWRKE